MDEIAAGLKALFEEPSQRAGSPEGESAKPDPTVGMPSPMVMRILGRMYLGGRGVRRDYRKAYIWFSLCAVSGGANDQVSTYIDKVARHLTPHQRSEAQSTVEGLRSSAAMVPF